MATAVNENGNQMEQFIKEISEIPNYFTQGLLKSFDDEDMKNVVSIYATTLKNQFKEVALIVEDSFSRGSAQEKK